jgi:hypothetical protein
MPNSLIFIPDISGFTEFVNNTEITHSQHIISELLELIIKSNDLEMLVAEIEGDAVLFVKEGSVPSVEELILQGEKMFLQFHRHLLQYESHRICNCGACSTASKLSLKVIIHASEIGFTFVNNLRKPFGPGLITGHRLLKNSIFEKEYVLFSDFFFKDIGVSHNKLATWIKFDEGIAVYEGIGETPYKYVPLKALRKNVHKVEPIQIIPHDSNPVIIEGTIQRSAKNVFEIISNLDYRQLWNKQIKELIYDKNKVNRSGTKHICVFTGSKVEIETVKNNVGSNKLVYGERLHDAPIVKDISFYYTLESIENSTNVRIEIFIHPTSFIGKLLLPLVRMNTKRITRKAFKSLKEFCELEADH